jgi:hypothetical protein
MQYKANNEYPIPKTKKTNKAKPQLIEFIEEDEEEIVVSSIPKKKTKTKVKKAKPQFIEFIEEEDDDANRDVWKVNIKCVNEEFKLRAMLPRHIYEFRPVMKEMLLVHFKVKLIKKREKTELITRSYAI